MVQAVRDWWLIALGVVVAVLALIVIWRSRRR
ncbi:MAG: LPXTG cell wall anchor domain-containing protein [Candidatus Rokubacteria bacterium]|jgi:LPXTG-motif cell wall-anchored protein|nr:LPXTG cell wall anchor domain-containing protein [Candidatus Rokubacteria bacterium]